MLSTLSTVFTPDALAALWRGAQLTLSLTVLASIFGLILGLIAGLGRMSRLAPVRLLAGAYIETFRGTPLLVQLFFLFFALPQITGVSLPAFNTAVLGLSLFAGAYAAVLKAGRETPVICGSAKKRKKSCTSSGVPRKVSI